MDAKAVGDEAMVVEAVGAKAMGAKAVGAEAVGAKTVGFEAVRAEALGAEALGGGALGAEAVDAKAVGPKAVGAEDVREEAEAVGTEAVAKMAAHLEGKQEVVQPPASKSDERFRGRMTVYAATVAHDRSGNERSVNVCKRSAMMKRGFKPGMNPIRFNAVWRGWAFRANFMYEAVL